MFNVHVSDLYHVSVWWLVHIILGVSTECEIVHEVCGVVIFSQLWERFIQTPQTPEDQQEGAVGDFSSLYWLVMSFCHDVVLLKRM